MHRMGMEIVASDTDLAYLAGLIDGEAYIGIKKGRRRDMVSAAYHERVQVRMVDEPAIAFLADTLGGNYYKETPHSAQGRPLYCYQASDLKACQVLEAVLPWLRVKRESALTVLRLRALKAAKRTKVVGEKNFPNQYGTSRMVPVLAISDENIAEREVLYLRCKELNRVGI